MPLITETYYLSLTQDNRGILRLRCSQDDTLRTVNLKLYNNGSIFAIPSGISASVSGVKQNGAVFSKPCTISQDRESVVLQLSSDITNVDGIIVAEIVLNDGEGGRLGTSNFIIQVEKNPIRAGVVQDTETPIEYINDFIEKIQTLTARLNNLITPSGDPSLAEVVDARIGVLDSTTYQTLAARLNAEFQRLSNALNGIAILESTGDTTDRTSEILSKLNTYGTCKLGKGDFYVSNLVMPEGSRLIGSGKSTRVILPSAVTNGYVVKPRSNCIIENISFYGWFTGTYSELIASSANATRHCIILDRFDSVSSENVILSNIFINNFVGSAIIQRYTTGCHCKDVVINMCYVGIDISNTSYDGLCTNVYMNDTRYGVVQNGSNFVFSGCISKYSEYHIMSDQQNTECTFSSCTFFDSSLETTSVLAYLSNARNGFVFDNCMFDSSLKMGLNACDGIVIKGTNFVGSDTFRIIVSNSRNTLLLITDCIADVEPTVTNAGTAAHITSCYLKDGTAWSISESSESEADITVDDELSDESENPVQNKVINGAISEIKADLGDLNDYNFDELFSELQISETQNLYNKDTAEDGYIAANGNTSPSTTYCYSAKIPVKVGKTYSFLALYKGAVVSANARFLCAYDSNGNAVTSAGSNSAVASYTVPDGIASIVVSFEQNRKRLFMVVEGSETPSGLLPYNLEHYIASPSFISSAVGDILRTNEQLKISVTSATANTEYKLVEHLDNKKNCNYSFFGKFSSFTSIEIGHGKTEWGANYLVIDGTNITSYQPNGTEYAHYAHNLTITDFISVSIRIADTATQRATVTIITNGGSATVGNVIFLGCNGAIYFICGQETTGVDFAYSIMDLCKDVYVFGDSYISLANDKRWSHYAITNKDNNMLLSGFPGANASEEFPSFEKILSMGTPKYVCWFLGMNDNDEETSAPNPNWIVVTSQVISICKVKGIVPILATIPNTPTQRNTYKNAWVKASGERYVDFAKAVGAEELKSTWYTGMLSSDNVHPAAEGAKALWLQMRMDVPEIIQPITT